MWRERVLVAVDREAIWWQDTRMTRVRFGSWGSVTSPAVGTLYSRVLSPQSFLE